MTKKEQHNLTLTIDFFIDTHPTKIIWILRPGCIKQTIGKEREKGGFPPS
jgi:hypothetical protein